MSPLFVSFYPYSSLFLSPSIIFFLSILLLFLILSKSYISPSPSFLILLLFPSLFPFISATPSLNLLSLLVCLFYLLYLPLSTSLSLSTCFSLTISQSAFSPSLLFYIILSLSLSRVLRIFPISL
ncbi:hypothetical protein WA158_008132 [Blastocystis sp. Blastoise]